MTKLRKIVIDAPLVPISYLLGGMLAILIPLKMHYADYLWTVVYGVLMIVCGLIFVHTSLRGKQLMWDDVFNKLDIPVDSKVLDLGTGHGLVLIKFAANLSPRGHVTGIDLWRNGDQSNNSLENTKKLLNEKGLEKKTTLQTGDMLTLPLAAKQYDFVTASMAIHNIKTKQKRQQALNEATRVLKKDGQLIIVDTGYHKKEYLDYLSVLGYQIKYAHTYGIVGWWTGPWMASYAIIANKTVE